MVFTPLTQVRNSECSTHIMQVLDHHLGQSQNGSSKNGKMSSDPHGLPPSVSLATWVISHGNRVPLDAPQDVKRIGEKTLVKQTWMVTDEPSVSSSFII